MMIAKKAKMSFADEMSKIYKSRSPIKKKKKKKQDVKLVLQYVHTYIQWRKYLVLYKGSSFLFPNSQLLHDYVQQSLLTVLNCKRAFVPFFSPPTEIKHLHGVRSTFW